MRDQDRRSRKTKIRQTKIIEARSRIMAAMLYRGLYGTLYI